MSGVSIHDMEISATEIPDFGNSIEVNDIGDDYGMDLMANTRSFRPRNETIQLSKPSNNGGSFNIDSLPNALEEIDIQPADNFQNIQIDLGSGGNDDGGIAFSKDNYGSSMPSSSAPSNYNNYQTSSGPSVAFAPQMIDPNSQVNNAKKSDLINKLNRLESKGFPVAKRYTMDNSLEEVETEYNRLVDAKNMEASIRFQRNMLMSVVSGLEFLNNRFDPLDLKLDGWSENLHTNVEDFDDIFEELYDKYKDKAKMAPEARLVFSLASSGFMVHLTNSMFRAKMPSAEDVFKKNPELARQFAAAAASQVSPGMGNFVQMGLGGGSTREMPSGPAPNMPGEGVGAFLNSPRMPVVPQHVAAQPQVQTARREMKGPAGVEVDDILRTFEEVNQQSINPQVFMQPMGGQSSGASAMDAVSELQSVHSGDMSYMSERTNATGSRRPRGKARQAPVGNVINLNV